MRSELTDATNRIERLQNMLDDAIVRMGVWMAEGETQRERANEMESLAQTLAAALDYIASYDGTLLRAVYELVARPDVQALVQAYKAAHQDEEEEGRVIC